MRAGSSEEGVFCSEWPTIVDEPPKTDRSSGQNRKRRKKRRKLLSVEDREEQQRYESRAKKNLPILSSLVRSAVLCCNLSEYGSCHTNDSILHYYDDARRKKNLL